MATDKIKLVQGDTGPQLIVSITDSLTGKAVDVSDVGTQIRILFREVGAAAAKNVMPAYAIAGYLNPETGELETQPPYDVAGRGGRAVMDWAADALDTPGEFEAEVEVTTPSGRIQTAFNMLKFTVREQIREVAP